MQPTQRRERMSIRSRLQASVQVVEGGQSCGCAQGVTVWCVPPPGGHHLHLEQDGQRPGHLGPHPRHPAQGAQPAPQHHHGVQDAHRQHQVCMSPPLITTTLI